MIYNNENALSIGWWYAKTVLFNVLAVFLSVCLNITNYVDVRWLQSLIVDISIFRCRREMIFKIKYDIKRPIRPNVYFLLYKQTIVQTILILTRPLQGNTYYSTIDSVEVILKETCYGYFVTNDGRVPGLCRVDASSTFMWCIPVNW